MDDVNNYARLSSSSFVLSLHHSPPPAMAMAISRTFSTNTASQFCGLRSCHGWPSSSSSSSLRFRAPGRLFLGLVIVCVSGFLWPNLGKFREAMLTPERFIRIAEGSLAKPSLLDRLEFLQDQMWMEDAFSSSFFSSTSNCTETANWRLIEVSMVMQIPQKFIHSYCRYLSKTIIYKDNECSSSMYDTLYHGWCMVVFLIPYKMIYGVLLGIPCDAVCTWCSSDSTWWCLCMYGLIFMWQIACQIDSVSRLSTHVMVCVSMHPTCDGMFVVHAFCMWWMVCDVFSWYHGWFIVFFRYLLMIIWHASDATCMGLPY